MLPAVWGRILQVTSGPLCMQSLRPSKRIECEQYKYSETRLTCPHCVNLDKLRQ